MASATAGTTRACRTSSTRLEDVDIDPGTRIGANPLHVHGRGTIAPVGQPPQQCVLANLLSTPSGVCRVACVVGWYPGQPELEDESGTEGVAAADNSSISPGSSVPLPGVTSSQSNAALGSEGAVDGLGPAPGPEAAPRSDGTHKHRATTSVPSVLTKLQKWGDYASVGCQVVPTRFIPMKASGTIGVVHGLH